MRLFCLPNQAKGSHPNRLKIGIPGGDLEAASRLAGFSTLPTDDLRCSKYLSSNELGHLGLTEECYSMGRAREGKLVGWRISLDGSRDESDMLLSLIV
jgi:hypothetical protein